MVIYRLHLYPILFTKFTDLVTGNTIEHFFNVAVDNERYIVESYFVDIKSIMLHENSRRIATSFSYFTPSLNRGPISATMVTIDFALVNFFTSYRQVY